MVLAIGIPSGIYRLTLSGLERLGGAYILMGVAITIGVLIIDRSLVKVVKRKTLNSIEILLLLVGISFYLYQGREILLDIRPDSDYFVLIENNGSFQDSELKYKFPFSKELIPNGKHAVINSISDNFRQIKLNPPEDWSSYVMQPRLIDNINVQYYSKYDTEVEKRIDSLIRHEISSAARKMQNGN